MEKKIPVGKICCYTDEDFLKSVKNKNCYGFRLGVKLMAEPFLLPIGENKKQLKCRSGIGEISDAFCCNCFYNISETNRQ